MVSSVMHNSEAFGHKIPKDLETQYYKLIKSTLGVRQSTPNLIVLIESGLLPLKALITSRQQGFFKRFGESVQHGSSRSRVFEILKQDKNEDYIQHYVTMSEKYSSKDEIYAEFVSDLKDQVNKLADEGLYKYQIYRKMNPSLDPSPFLNLPHPHTETIIKFRLGSHKLPIKTGRWKGLDRCDRVCPECQVLGDEEHYLFNCSLVRRDDLLLPEEFGNLWKNANVFKLFARLVDVDLL